MRRLDCRGNRRSVCDSAKKYSRLSCVTGVDVSKSASGKTAGALLPRECLRDMRQFSETGEETLLVFAAEQPMVVTVDKPWYRKLFSRSQKLDQEVTHANADYGDANVQFSVGLNFASRAGEAQDYLQAAEWYRKAADQCHSLAQFNLGTMYANGQGVAQDEAQSAIWFGKAAQQGDAGAQFNLGRSCHRASLGEVTANTSESRIEAYKWYHLAAAQGYKESDTACTTLILTMSRADVTIANQRVTDFEAEQPKRPQT